jgi:hypothetical protein
VPRPDSATGSFDRRVCVVHTAPLASPAAALAPLTLE